jgi:hypothetical protein
MRILSVGSFNGRSNTCVHRNKALEKIARVDTINMYEKSITLWYRIANRSFLYGFPVRLPDISNSNKKIRKFILLYKYDVIWIDKGLLINKQTLKYIKKHSPDAIIVSYSPDNMALRHNQSQNYLECIRLYDYIFTNKSYILDDMKKMGAKNIQFVNNSYEATFHFPRKLSETDYNKLGGDVGFIGAWEKERCESILHLAKNGVKVRVFGDKKWQSYKSVSKNLIIEDHGLFDEDYSKSLQAFKISLCFLRKINFDQQTTRSIEIPACGGFMMAERTKEHLALFEEGKEAEFFSTNEELLEKCRYYIINEDERKRIAEAGNLRCQTSGYSNEETIKRLITIIMSDFR